MKQQIFKESSHVVAVLVDLIHENNLPVRIHLSRENCGSYNERRTEALLEYDDNDEALVKEAIRDAFTLTTGVAL